MPNPEQPIKEGILNWLRLQGAWAQNIQSGALLKSYGDRVHRIQLADAGTPDIIGWFKGNPFGVEVKASEAERQKWERQWQKHLATGEFKPSWQRSIEQHMQHEAIEKAGGTVMVCCSIEEVEQDFHTLGWL